MAHVIHQGISHNLSSLALELIFLDFEAKLVEAVRQEVQGIYSLDLFETEVGLIRITTLSMSY